SFAAGIGLGQQRPAIGEPIVARDPEPVCPDIGEPQLALPMPLLGRAHVPLDGRRRGLLDARARRIERAEPRLGIGAPLHGGAVIAACRLGLRRNLRRPGARERGARQHANENENSARNLHDGIPDVEKTAGPGAVTDPSPREWLLAAPSYAL